MRNRSTRALRQRVRKYGAKRPDGTPVNYQAESATSRIMRFDLPEQRAWLRARGIKGGAPSPGSIYSPVRGVS